MRNQTSPARIMSTPKRLSGPAPPGDHAGKDVPEQRPHLERRVDARLAQVIARQRKQNGATGRRHARHCDRDEDGGARSGSDESRVRDRR